MLAHRPKPKPTNDDFQALLTLPAKPEAVEACDFAWRNAVAERQAAQSCHVEARHQLDAQVAGGPPSITQREVDELCAQLAPLVEAESVAAEARVAARKKYQEDILAGLHRPLIDYRSAIADELDELDKLLGIGAALHSAGVAAGVTLSSKLPGLCHHILEEGVQSARRILNRVSV